VQSVFAGGVPGDAGAEAAGGVCAWTFAPVCAAAGITSSMAHNTDAFEIMAQM
jgi:hypothetical protein